MKSIYYKQENGSLAVIAFFNEEAVAKTIESLKENNVPFGEITESTNIDDFFFDAYIVSQSGELSVNIEKAKEIQRNKWRFMREPLLKQLDVDYMRAVERADTAAQQEIVAKKQQLRDVTLIELPDSLEGIKAMLPGVLASYSTNYDENGIEINAASSSVEPDPRS